MRSIRVGVDCDREFVRQSAEQAGQPLSFFPSAVFIMEEDHEPIAVVGLDWSTSIAQLGPLFLLPGHENKRWAILRLVEFAEAFLLKAGISTYSVSVAEDNLRVLRFLSRLHFRPDTASDGYIWYVREVDHE